MICATDEVNGHSLPGELAARATEPNAGRAERIGGLIERRVDEDSDIASRAQVPVEHRRDAADHRSADFGAL